MLLLLPPSEGKSAPTSGRPVDLGQLTHPRLHRARNDVLDALIALSRRDDAAQVLGVGARSAADVAANTRLRSAPTAEARRVYAGVLYAAAGLGSLTGTGLRRAQASVRTVSALWGLVAPRDPIAAYRLAMGTDLPGIGNLAHHWRGPLAAELDPWAAEGLVVDCRSAAYRAAWAPPRTPRVVAVQVLRERDGKRSVVSHEAKHTRGLLAGHLLRRAAALPRTPEDLAQAALGLALTAVELEVHPRGSVLSLVLSGWGRGRAPLSVPAGSPAPAPRDPRRATAAPG